jgi:hypothetical protein
VAVALLFVVAAPILVAIKIVIARYAKAHTPTRAGAEGIVLELKKDIENAA